MDPRFHAAQQAIRDDQPERLEALLRAQPELRHVASEDPRDHPNLLNCLVLELPPRRDLRDLMALFREGGADLGSALVAAASVDNRPAVRALLDWGTPLNPSTGWSALDEALYWVGRRVARAGGGGSEFAGLGGGGRCGGGAGLL
jgi:hypothetical protein